MKGWKKGAEKRRRISQPEYGYQYNDQTLSEHAITGGFGYSSVGGELVDGVGLKDVDDSTVR